MRTIFGILIMFFVGCELDIGDLEKDPPELLISECEEGYTRCDYAKEFVQKCQNGFWDNWTDCFQLDKTCFLYEGVARCRADDEEEEIEVVE